jgi:hypothetical protein
LFTGHSERYVKKMALETSNSVHRGPVGELGRGFFHGEIWETVKQCSINGASVSMGALWGKYGRRELRKLGLVSTRRQARKLI